MAKLDLSLTLEDLDDFLAGQRTVRLATVDPLGLPQVVPLWFVWLEEAMFLNSTLGNLTVRNFEANPRVSAVVDDGASYDELRGAILRGRVERANDDPRIPAVADAWSVKYMGGNPVPYDRWKNRAWFRLEPEEITSWDFRKIAEAKARAKAEGGGRS
jgi:nitroimidazol reductase NimA-like FMN-containing flavoprotein (pyridoxamine 5'-phosphate oxidase superfamily)